MAAPAIGSESASEAVSWIVCSAGAANGVHGPCDRYQASRLALRASWSSRWLAAPNRLHCKSTLCSDAMLYSCTARSDGLSAHRSHPDFGAWHLASDCVCGVSRRGVQVNVPALVVLFRRNGGMEVSLRVILIANIFYSIASDAASHVASATDSTVYSRVT